MNFHHKVFLLLPSKPLGVQFGERWDLDTIVINIGGDSSVGGGLIWLDGLEAFKATIAIWVLSNGDMHLPKMVIQSIDRKEQQKLTRVRRKVGSIVFT